tara:strand:- start:724 stop:1053 length:330 start_codon:yes stop_codon:yes gene_type:complete
VSDEDEKYIRATINNFNFIYFAPSSLGTAFLKSGMPKKEIFYFLSAFSCMGPIGVAIGMAVNEFAAPIVDAFMLATVAGTFIYVGATEVIPEEVSERTSGNGYRRLIHY